MLAHFIESKTFPCGYFKGRQSFFEEYLLADISETEFERLLARGTRHFGEYYFRPRCLDCCKCIPIRIRVADFRPARNQKRAAKNCAGVEVRAGPPRYTGEKFRLYLKHKKRFEPLQDDVEDERNFNLSFYETMPFGVEFEYYQDGRLVGVALADVTRNAFSAIYTFYDPPAPRMSLGTFSILKQMEFAAQRRIEHFYLGYYVDGNRSLSYKGNFLPSEVYVDGGWRPFRDARGTYLLPGEELGWRNTERLVNVQRKPGLPSTSSG